MTASRYVVGIDLGTTNTGIAYVDTGADDAETARPEMLAIPQVVQPGSVEERPLVPSYLYLPLGSELPAGSLNLPWAKDRDFVVGTFARQHGGRVPTRLVNSAKSWLCHPGIDRKGPVLPWKAPEGTPKLSPLEVSTRYLRHLADAWNHLIAKDIPDNRLEHQEIILTVPASFDAVARELTAEAAREAGLEHVTLLEEPQAAFYAWIDASDDDWRDKVEVGDAVLICDVGGGTTDLTLIAVGEEGGQLALSRVAIGNHILLGGDNMDLALAHAMAKEFSERNIKLDSAQMLMLWHSCRSAKEQFFANPELQETAVTVLGRGSKLIGGTIKGDLTRTKMEEVLLEGFFPECEPDAEPMRSRGVGLQEMGLPYASDAAITRHLASFLHQHREQLGAVPQKRRKNPLTSPTAVLFNGGVFKGDLLQQRLTSILGKWGPAKQKLKVLDSVDLDHAVARGAAYYGLVRRGKGIRIRGGTARTYYIGIETSLPAVPGSPPPIKALCVVPYGMEEGTEADLPDQEFGLIVGEPVEFRFLGSTTRRTDEVGTLLDDWEDDIDELAPLATTLDGTSKDGQTVPVHLMTKVTEIGTLELWCLSRDGKDRWKLEFNVREQPQ